MDIETLENRMSKLNDFELAYRDGTQRDWLFPPELVEQEEGILRIKKSIFLDFTGGSGIGRGRKPLVHDQWLFVFRTLRFEPAPEHVHGFVELFYAYRGSARQRVNGQEITIKEGQVLFLDSNCPHLTYPLGADDILISVCVEEHFLQSSLEALRTTDDLLTSFLMGTLDEQADHNRFLLLSAEHNQRIRRLFQELMCEYVDPSPNAGRILSGLFQLLLVNLLNVYEGDLTRAERETTKNRVLAAPIIGYIQKNYLDCTLESVAERFYVSPNYVSRILKRSTGKTYQQLVQDLRITHAANLISIGGYSVEDAAKAVGYTNISFFYRKFREAFGMTPAEYRTYSLN